jgi:hypothetical protein
MEQQPIEPLAVVVEQTAVATRLAVWAVVVLADLVLVKTVQMELQILALVVAVAQEQQVVVSEAKAVLVLLYLDLPLLEIRSFYGKRNASKK